MNHDRQKNISRYFSLALSAAVFFVPLAVYVALLPSTTSFEDSGEFVTAATVLGILHPSGYPLYVLLAHPFTWLPFGTIPWRVTLFSAVCAAGSVWLLFVMARHVLARLFDKKGPLVEASAAVVSLMFAFSLIWWTQAIYAKVYTLHVLLILACFYSLLRWGGEDKEKKWLYAAALLLGLSGANHFSLTVIAGPFLAAGAVVMNPGVFKRLKTYIVIALAGLAGLSPYAFIVIRAKMGAPYSFGSPDNFGKLIDHVLRLHYGDVGLSGWNRFGLVMSFVKLWGTELSLLGLLFTAVGVYFLFRRPIRKRIPFAVLCLGLIVSPILISMLRRMDWSAPAEYVARVYYLHAIAAGYLLAAVGAALGAEYLSARGWFKTTRLAVIGLAGLTAAVAYLSAPALAPFRDDFGVRYAQAILDSLPRNSVFVINDEGFTTDTLLFTFAYMQAVQGQRPDVTVINDVGIAPFYSPKEPVAYAYFSRPWRRVMMLRTVLADPLLRGRPVFSSFMPPIKEVGPAPTNGLIFAVRCDQLCHAGFSEQLVKLDLPDSVIFTEQMALKSIMGHILYNRAAYFAKVGDQEGASQAVIRALNLSPTPHDDDYVSFMRYREEVLLQH